jgi:hypothetical protein
MVYGKVGVFQLPTREQSLLLFRLWPRFSMFPLLDRQRQAFLFYYRGSQFAAIRLLWSQSEQNSALVAGVVRDEF